MSPNVTSAPLVLSIVISSAPSRLEPGPYTGRGEFCMKRKSVWGMTPLMLAFAITAFAGQGDVKKDKRDIRRDKQELKSDAKDVRRDTRDIRKDKAELKDDREDGNK